jgi:ubiquitin carboxyl-terminal hydrolase 9/13
MLCQKNKFFCDSCCDLQEAEKRCNFHSACFTLSLTFIYRMKIKRLPNVLALHLKRFKYQEDVARYIKLVYRVAFPYELRLFNTVDDMDDADRLYNLFAIVVHVGKYVCSLLFLVLYSSCSFSGPHHGHYISIIKTAGTWFVFDDDNVYPISENDIPKYFGDSNAGSAYVLYYQAVNIDLVSLGLRPLEPPPETITSLTPPVQPYTALQNQTVVPVPTLPPGLSSNSAASLESVVDHNHIPPPSTTPSPVLHHSELEEVIPPSIPQSRELLTANPAATSSTSGFGTKFINTIRRAPSLSGARGTIGASSGLVPNGRERRSTVEKTPRASLSTPSFTPSGESLQEQPPPLPPLPPGILHRSDLNVTPILNTQVSDPKKEKEKDKTKLTTGGWFSKKRKSLRVSEKSRSEYGGVPDPSPFPAIKGDERHGSHTVPSSSSPNIGPVLTDHIGPRQDNLRSEKSEDRRLNGYFRKSPPEPASLFPGPPWNSTDRPSTTTHPSHTHSRSSTVSDMGSSAQPESGRPSLARSSEDRYRPVDRKKSVDSRPLSPSYTPRPMTAPSSPSRMTSDLNRTLPPLPPNSKTKFHRTNLSLNNGQAFSKEPAIGEAKSLDVDDSSTSDKPSYPRSIISEPPASMAASVGQNSSVGSVNSATSNIKRATRKLSLGFGKRNKKKTAGEVESRQALDPKLSDHDLEDRLK